MRIIRHGIRNLFIVGLMAWTIPTMAQWELDTDRSALNFVSIKNNSIAETHVFNSMVGFVGEDGRVQLAIDLAGHMDRLGPRGDLADASVRKRDFDGGNGLWHCGFDPRNATAARLGRQD